MKHGYGYVDNFNMSTASVGKATCYGVKTSPKKGKQDRKAQKIGIIYPMIKYLLITMQTSL